MKTNSVILNYRKIVLLNYINVIKNICKIHVIVIT